MDVGKNELYKQRWQTKVFNYHTLNANKNPLLNTE